MIFYDDLIADADASQGHAIALDELAEPQCFTTAAFRRSVGRRLAR